MSHVKSLREKFERVNKATAKPMTPTEFAEAQKRSAEAEARAIVDSRRKAATYNMTVRALQIKSAYQSSSSSSNQNLVWTVDSSSSSGTSNKFTKRENATVKFADDVKDVDKSELRARARKYSVSLVKAAESSDNAEVASKAAEILEEKERQATQAILETISMTADEEAEKIKKAEQEAKQKAEQEERERIEKELKEKAEQEAKEKAEQEAKDKAEQEARELAEQEAKRIAEEEEHDRQTLTVYLKENYPDRLGDVEALIKEYHGHLDILFEELAKAKLEAEAAKAQKEAEESQARSIHDDHVEHLSNDSAVDQTLKNDLQFIQSEAPKIATAASAPPPTNDPKPKSPRDKKKFLDDDVSLEDLLKHFYTVFAPTKVNDVPSVMKHFENRESDLIHTLEVKYNVTFMSDGSCTPNDAAVTGEPFIVGSKFAVDVQKVTLRERLKQAGAPPEKVKEVLSSTSEMM